MKTKPTTPQTTDSLSTGIQQFIGVDVAKAEVVVSQAGREQTVSNTKRGLVSWLKALPSQSVIGLESTNCYHELLAELATAAGHIVYVLNPKALKHYRVATSGRAKTDNCDARLIVRYLEKEHTTLHPYTQPTETMSKLSKLLHRRATAVKCEVQLRQSLKGDAKSMGMGASSTAVFNSFKKLFEDFDAKINALLRHDEVREKADRLLSIKGVGPLTGAALLIALERGTFVSSDALVAFTGLDPVARDSGQHRGQRRLSKQGDGETRRLLFNAARAGCNSEVWRPTYKRFRERGLSDTQALCAIGRKILRTAWSIHKHQTTFCPERINKELAPGPAPELASA